MREKVPFFCKDRQLVFHSSRLPQQVQMPQRHILDRSDSPDREGHSGGPVVEGAQDERQHFFDKMGPHLNSLLEQNIRLWRKVLQ